MLKINFKSYLSSALIRTLIVISIVEVMVMLVFNLFQLEISAYLKAMLDALFLSLLSTPILLYWVVRPVHKKVITAQCELRQYKDALDAHSIVAITDTAGNILKVNDKFCKISGFSQEELIGQNHRLLNSGNKDKNYWKQMYHNVANKHHWYDEVQNINKDGHLYWVATTIIPILNQYKKPEKYIAIRTDITNIKRVETEIQLKNNLLSKNIVELERSKFETEKALEDLSQQTLELQSEIARRLTVEHQMERMALYDYLTDLPNRRLLFQQAEKLIASATRYKSILGILFLDLDGFKAVNDNNGHEIGDAVLVEISLRISDAVREIDEISRVGGDEFIILLPNCDSKNDIKIVANRILKAVSNPVEYVEISESVTASIGASIFPEDGSELNELVTLADKAMYQSKKRGKNCLTFHRTQ